MAVAIQGAGEWVSVTSYRRPGVCRSGGSPAFPVFGVVQHDVGGEHKISSSIIVSAVHVLRQLCQLRSVGNLVGVFRRTATARKGCGYRAVPYFPGSVDLGRGLPVEPQFGEQAVFAARAKGQRQHGQEQCPEKVYSRFHTK